MLYSLAKYAHAEEESSQRQLKELQIKELPVEAKSLFLLDAGKWSDLWGGCIGQGMEVDRSPQCVSKAVHCCREVQKQDLTHHYQT